MKKIIVLIALFISVFAVAQRKDKLILVDKGDPVMELAFAEAKQTLDEFISRATEKRSENETYGAYIKVVEGEAVEYLWISDFQKYDDTYFMGVLITKPALISQFKEGATVGVLKEDIYDWQIYNKETDMTEGAFTFKVLKKNK
jgi:uncharacterized protein YegJ (DUF2314 family)